MKISTRLKQLILTAYYIYVATLQNKLQTMSMKKRIFLKIGPRV